MMDKWHNIGSFRTNLAHARYMQSALTAAFTPARGRPLIKVVVTPSADRHTYNFSVRLFDERVSKVRIDHALQHIWGITLDVKRAIE